MSSQLWEVMLTVTQQVPTPAADILQAETL